MKELGRWDDGPGWVSRRVRFQVLVPARPASGAYGTDGTGAEGNLPGWKFSPQRIPGAIVGKWKQVWLQVES